MSAELVRKPLHYDALQRRLWIRGQRCHHGATGVVLAGAGMVGLLALFCLASVGAWLWYRHAVRRRDAPAATP